MIYSNNNGIATDRILTEVARFQPSASVPASLKKTVIGVCNNILNKSKKLDREDKKVDRALKVIEGAIALAKDNSYTDNAYPVEIHAAITGGEACMEYAISVVRAMGFKHSNMKEGKKGQTWYKVSGNDILVATIVGTLFGNGMATIILHAVENSDHNNDILNGVLESATLTEGQQAEEYKARKQNERSQQHQKDSDRLNKMTTQDNDPVGNKRANDNIKNGKAPTDGMSSKEKEDYHKKIDRVDRAQIKVVDHFERRGEDFHPLKPGHADAMRTASRHARRHPEQYKEGTIFESVKFI